MVFHILKKLDGNMKVYQLGEFSSVKNQASQELDCLLVIKGFAFQAVKKKKKKRKWLVTRTWEIASS